MRKGQVREEFGCYFVQSRLPDTSVGGLVDCLASSDRRGRDLGAGLGVVMMIHKSA